MAVVTLEKGGNKEDCVIFLIWPLKSCQWQVLSDVSYENSTTIIQIPLN